MDTKMNVDDIKIGGMSCASCAKAVERAVKKLDSSVQASVNMATEKLSISYDKEKVKNEDIEKAMSEELEVANNIPSAIHKAEKDGIFG